MHELSSAGFSTATGVAALPLRPFLPVSQAHPRGAAQPRPTGRAALSLGLASLGVLAALAAPAAGQELLVSTTANATGAGPLAFVDDATLVRVGSAPPRSFFGEGHWLAATGRIPGDVDALALRPGKAPAAYDALAFSLLSNEGGFDDGDVLALAPGGGIEVVVAEADLALALGTPGAALDLDAFTWDDQGALVFSLQSDLAGTAAGDLSDGDLVRWDGTAAPSVLLTEAEVQARYTDATGSVAAVGDVIGLSWDQGIPWVVVQSPSGADGAVLACGAVGSLVYDESQIDLGGQELDGLALLPAGTSDARLWADDHAANPGDTLGLHYAGGTPGGVLLALVAGDAGFQALPGIGGWGAAHLSPTDPFLSSYLSSGSLALVSLDGAGAFSTSLGLPAGLTGGTGFGGESGWSLQFIDLTSLETTAPFRIGF